MSKHLNKISPLSALARCLLLATLSLSALLAGCDKEEHQPPVVQGNVPISFSATTLPMKPASRGETTSENILSMRVFASYTKTDDFGATSPMNYMYNQEVTRADNNSPWKYLPVKYWPNKAGEKISFFAYGYSNISYPAGITLSPKTANGYPYINYPAGRYCSTDLVCATAKNKTSSSSGGGVSFEMEHVMTRIKVSVVNKDKVANMNLEYFFIGKHDNGKYSFADGSWSFPGGALVHHSPDGISWPQPVPSSGTSTLDLVPHYFFVPIMPQAMTPEFNIKYTVPGSNGTEETIELNKQPLPSTEKWLKGAFLSYKIVIEKQKLTVTASAHPTWTDGGTGTVVGTLSIVYAVNPSDPSWGNGGFGSIDGVPIVTHTVQPGEVPWENNYPPEIVDVPAL